MKEFVVFIKNQGNPIVGLSPEDQQAHIQKVGTYIKTQFESRVMKAAQPFEMEGIIISKQGNKFIETSFDDTEEVISGYYLIKAADLKSAVQIAKSDPRFNDGIWKMEIRPIMKVDGFN